MDLLTTATSRDERERQAQAAVLPVGSFEQHGDFLPLITDTVIACSIAERISADYGLFLLPPVTVSCSHEHAGFAGTVSIRAETLMAVVHDIAESLRESGVNRLAIVNGHGGNYVLSNVVQQANRLEPWMTLYPGHSEWAAARVAAGLESTASEDMHAGEGEVSILLHVAPGLIRAGYQGSDWDAAERPHLLVSGMKRYTRSGVIGRPSLATEEKGKAMLDSLSLTFKEHLALLA